MKLKLIAYVLLLFVFKQTIVLSENLDISVYTGTFDVIDKEGDDQTTLIGVEHRNTDLFRNTLIGKCRFGMVTHGLAVKKKAS